jgi:hypothetical protein
LVKLHLKSRANFLQRNFFVVHLRIGVVAEGDVVIVIREGDHSFALVLWGGEKMLQDIGYPNAQLSREIIEY